MKARGRQLGLQVAAALLLLSMPGRISVAATLDNITVPDTQVLAGTKLQLNGLALRTYSILRVPIYVAALYVEQPSTDADAILAERHKMMVVHFLRDVDEDGARKSWREGFATNCKPPCHVEPADVERFLASVPAVRAGDVGVLSFLPSDLQISMNGQLLGTIGDPHFARVVLSTFIGVHPPTERVRRELLGLPN